MSTHIKKKRLVALVCSVSSNNDLVDHLQIIAANIESSLIQAGAAPGEDYTILDLYKLAQPFALHRFQKGELEYTTAWPDT